MVEEYKQVIIVRTDLNMRKGKMITQGAHASLEAVLSIIERSKFTSENHPTIKAWRLSGGTKITLAADSENHLLELASAAKNLRLNHALIQDLGKTEFKGIKTYTALAIGPEKVDLINAITKNLKLL